MSNVNTVVHTKIGNGYGGYEHAAGETACGLNGKGRKITKNEREATCPGCVKEVNEQFGEE